MEDSIIMKNLRRKLNDTFRKVWPKTNVTEINIDSERRIESEIDGRVTTTTARSNYIAKSTDEYIGVNSDSPSTICLPANCPDGKVIIVKAEMKPPIGNRKIKIIVNDESKIDGYSEYQITVSHDSVKLIRNNGHWWTI